MLSDIQMIDCIEGQHQLQIKQSLSTFFIFSNLSIKFISL